MTRDHEELTTILVRKNAKKLQKIQEFLDNWMLTPKGLFMRFV